MWTLESIRKELGTTIVNCRKEIRELYNPSAWSVVGPDILEVEAYNYKIAQLNAKLEYAERLYLPFLVEDARLKEEKNKAECDKIMVL